MGEHKQQGDGDAAFPEVHASVDAMPRKGGSERNQLNGFEVPSPALVNPSPEPPQKFAVAGHLVVSAERLMGYYASSGLYNVESGEHYLELEEHDTFMSFLVPANGEYGAEVSGIPRIAGDYFVSDRITMGASVGYAAYSGNYDLDSNYIPPNSGQRRDFDALMAGARLGYAKIVAEGVGVWSRVGFTYSGWKTEDPVSSLEISGSMQSINLEGLVTLLPTPSFGVHAGIVIDVSMTGTQIEKNSAGGREAVVSRRTIGLVAGLMGIL